MSAALAVETTPVPGLLVLRLPLHEDARGWFKENWQRQKMVGLGLPDFEPVQQNVSWNTRRGATRGIHAEPWDKLVSVSGGRAFGAWVDLREGASYGATFHVELTPETAVFVPRGVGNSYQTLDDEVAYSYLVNDHWRPGITYPALALDDPTAAIPWPIPLADSEISEKDRQNPSLADAVRFPPRRTLVLGAQGQVGRALVGALDHADGAARPGSGADLELDLAVPGSWDVPWHDYDVVVNAAAYTAVDAAETPEGRRTAWAVNAVAPAELARLSNEHRFTLVHYSTEYVFDGTVADHVESEQLAPLGVYAQSKAAGEVAVAAARRHYLLRTSWVVGDGGNFVRTMLRLAAGGVSPSVVTDQTGRLSFADEIARATDHLVTTGAAYGTYHVSNGGPVTSWHEVAARVFALAGRDVADVGETTTPEYSAGKEMAPRPMLSAFDLAKLRSTGFEPEDATVALERYVRAAL
ncbi:MAG: dTDP-4-dehydrorhamnose reductase [Nocardioides sp.]|nr:dTDP-4-dehydrorhamnose reductase [Nocardioides sp.]